MDNPFRPTFGASPLVWAGRAAVLTDFERAISGTAGNPDRSILISGSRGIGKTVLLNTLRSGAVRAPWGTGKFEARPDQRLRRPLASALHTAVRELGHPQDDDVDHVLGVIKSFAQRDVGEAEVVGDAVVVG